MPEALISSDSRLFADDSLLYSVDNKASNCKLLYKVHCGLVDIDKTAYLKPGDSRTRSHTGFYQEHTTHALYHNSVFPRTIREWNRLPNIQCHLSALCGQLPCGSEIPFPAEPPSCQAPTYIVFFFNIIER